MRELFKSDVIAVNPLTDRTPDASIPPLDPQLSAHPKTEPSPTGSTARRSLRDLVRWHRKRVGYCALAGAISGVAYLSLVGPSYTAQARLCMPAPVSRNAITHIAGVQVAEVNRDKYLDTQAQLIVSDGILNHLHEFLPGAENLKTIRRSGDDAAGYIRDHLIAKPEEDAEILNVSLKARSESDATQLVSALIDTFIHHEATERQSVANDLLRTLRVEKSSAAVEAARLEEQLNAYTRDNPNLSVEAAMTIAKSKLQTLSDQLTQAQLATLRAEQSFAADHPTRRQALQLEVEISNALKLAQDDILVLNEQLAQTQKLETSVKQQHEAIRQIEKRIENLELQRDAEAAHVDITVMEPARVEHASLAAHPFLALGTFVLGGALIGIGWSLHRESDDRRLRCADDVRQALGDDGRILGVVPLLPKRRTPISKAMATHLDPRGRAAEAHRTVRSSLLVSSDSARRRTILVTSPNPGDGKSACATNLCIALAQAGRSVILVDADLRHPTQQVNLDLHDGAGLCEVMESPAKLRWAIQPSGIDNFHALIAGRTTKNPSEVFASDEFRRLLGELTSRYDHVVIDSPPVNVVNDATLISGRCDATVLVVRAEHTTQEDASRATELLKKSGAKIAGIVVNAAPAGENFGVYDGAYFPTVDTTLRNGSAHSKVRPTSVARPTNVPSVLQPV